VTGGVAQVARHDVSTARVDQKANVAKSAPAVVSPAASGGATAAVGTVPAEHAASEPTGATGATEPASVAPVTPVATDEAVHAKPVVEKDSTTVTLGTGQGAADKAGSQESPGLPTGDGSQGATAPPAAPAAPAPSPPSDLTGAGNPAPTAGTANDGASGGSGPTE
jgi:hypothetical protein